MLSDVEARVCLNFGEVGAEGYRVQGFGEDCEAFHKGYTTALYYKHAQMRGQMVEYLHHAFLFDHEYLSCAANEI